MLNPCVSMMRVLLIENSGGAVTTLRLANRHAEYSEGVIPLMFPPVQTSTKRIFPRNPLAVDM